MNEDEVAEILTVLAKEGGSRRVGLHIKNNLV